MNNEEIEAANRKADRIVRWFGIVFFSVVILTFLNTKRKAWHYREVAPVEYGYNASGDAFFQMFHQLDCWHPPMISQD